MQTRRIRPVFRLAALVFFVASGVFGLSWGIAASPFVFGNSLLGGILPTAAGWLGAAVLVVCIARRRWFCRWGCPVGLLLGRVASLSNSRRRLFKIPLGRWLALASLGGAASGIPLLLWLDPVVLFTGGFGAAGERSRIVAVASLGILAGITLLSLLQREVWCHSLCPAGGLQDLYAAWRQGLHAQASAQEPRPGRRRVLAALGGAAVFGTGVLLGRIARGSPKLAPPLRPPGAVDESRLAGMCSRCGNCVRACPAGIIRPETQMTLNLLTPIVEFAQDYCRENCVRCTEVCPTGALRRLTFADKRAAKIGLARVDLDLCWLTFDRECNICGRACPYEAITFEWNEETYTRVPRIDPRRCNGCGACEVACPASGEDDTGNSAKAVIVTT